MASPCGASSGSSRLLNTQSEEDLMIRRKQRRMLSNRESARRSRMRKQKHLDDLMAEASRMREENCRMMTALAVTERHCSAVEAQNAVLRAQVAELDLTLQSLDNILRRCAFVGCGAAEECMGPWSSMSADAAAAAADVLGHFFNQRREEDGQGKVIKSGPI
ncbi:bZIP transcription factor 44-like [Curcuma longa]|uniref:bZIP transcription factor 44-like n=1 Tax=Curcuma longa TaxID=136217 RepID=UPI003D9DE195